MELVGGVKITDYCDQHNLTTRQRLDLFIQVCRAIQHAHQKGIIHRDIKPSNVLVATQDGVPVPKVIDFGIAKATQGRLTDQTLFTAFEQFLGTPAYMSPEQAQLGGLDIDTRSDIYSLGVLLYELLTSKTPFDTKELVAAGLDAMRRTILEKEPPTPSTRLKQERLATRAAGLAKSEIQNLKSEIEKDLDWIVMKCLEKDRARRYQTANGLASDIERHLQDEPVMASPPSRIYRFQKAVRRNKTAFTAGAVVAVVLVTGIVVSTWQAVRATRAKREQIRLRQQAQTAQANEASEREKAQAEAIKSQQVAQFLKDTLSGVGPSVAQGRDTVMLREILEKTTERVGRELTNQPEVQIELLHTVALTYDELGLYQQVADITRETLRLARTSLGPTNAIVARELESLANAESEMGELELAEVKLREVLAIRREIQPEEDSTTGGAINSLALVLDMRGKWLEAEQQLRKALAIAKKSSGEETLEVSATLANLGMVLRHEGKLVDAEDTIRAALVLDRNLLGDQHPAVANTMNSLAVVLIQQGKSEAGVALLRDVLALRKKLLGDEHPSTAISLCNLAGALENLEKLPEAEERYLEALAIFRKLQGDDHPRVPSALDGLAHVYYRQKELGKAETTIRQALAISRKHLGEEHPDVGAYVENLATLLQEVGKLGEAEIVCKERLHLLRERVTSEDPELADAAATLAAILLFNGKFEDAESAARESLTIREKAMPNDWRTFNTRRILGASLLGQKRYADAEPLLLSSYDGLKQQESNIPINYKDRPKEAVRSLVQLYEATGQASEAEQMKQKLAELEQTTTNTVPTEAPPK